METREPDTYVITAVDMGDKPSGAISTVAQLSYPEASEAISESAYVDNIIDSINSTKEARKITRGIECTLKKASFHMKEWTISCGHNKISIDQSEE